MDQKQDAVEESAWPETRKALIEGLTAFLNDPQSSAYLRAQSEARLCGLHERAKADERWKAIAMMRALSSGAGLWDSIVKLAEAGESWEKVGPLVFKEWLFLIEESACRSNPFLPSRTDTNAGENAATVFVWLTYALNISQAGWAERGREGPQSKSDRSPLGEDEQLEMAKAFLKMREAAIESEKKQPPLGRLGFLRAFQSVFQSSAQRYWDNEEDAVGYFKAIVEKSGLEAQTPPGVKRAIGRRV